MAEEHFKPLPDELRERLQEVAGGAEPGEWVPLEGHDDRDEELEHAGMLESLRRYRSGGGRARVTARGASYEANLAAWVTERAALEDERRADEKRHEKRSFRHDWMVGLFTALVGLVAVFLAWLLGRLG